jgi:lysophospholipase L1-like esterase
MSPSHKRCRHLLATALLLTGLSAPASAQARPAFASTQPSARVEYWQERIQQIDKELLERKDLSSVRLVFLGDSITDFWLMDENLWVKGQFAGRKVWEHAFAGAQPENLAINLGVSGDRIEHVLHRITPRSAGGLGHLDAKGLKPEFIILMMGINNTWAAEEPVVDSILAGLKVTLATIHDRQPEAQIVLQSLLPTNEPAKNRDIVLPANEGLLALSQQPAFREYTHYLDLYPDYVSADGAQISRYFNDGLHPSPDGYEIWRTKLVNALQSLRQQTTSRRGD